MKRKTLKQTKADALNKLGSLKTKVKETIKTKTKDVSVLPSISKLMIASKAFMIKTLWLDKISSTVVATYVKLLRTTFGIIIKANLILAVIVYITQILGVENSFTYDLYVYLALFLYYTFRDTIFDYSGVVFDFFKSAMQNLFSKLYDVKVNVDSKSNMATPRNNITHQAKNSYSILKDSGKLDEVQPKHNYSDWSKTIMLIAAVCVVAFCFYCYDPDNFTKFFKFIGVAIWAIPNRVITAVRTIPTQISYLYHKIFKGGDGGNNGGGGSTGSAPANEDLNATEMQEVNVNAENNTEVINEEPEDPNNPLTIMGVIQAIRRRRQARARVNQQRNSENRVENTEIGDPAARPDSTDTEVNVTHDFGNPSNVQQPAWPLPWPPEDETEPNWLQIGRERIEAPNARANRATVDVGIETEGGSSTSTTDRAVNLLILPPSVVHRINRINRDRPSENTAGSGGTTPTPGTPTPQTTVLPQTNVEGTVPSINPQDPVVDPDLDYTQSLQRRLDAMSPSRTTQSTGASGSGGGNTPTATTSATTPSSSSTVIDPDTRSLADSNPSSRITGFFGRMRRSSSTSSSTGTTNRGRVPRTHGRRGGRGGT